MTLEAKIASFSKCGREIEKRKRKERKSRENQGIIRFRRNFFRSVRWKYNPRHSSGESQLFKVRFRIFHEKLLAFSFL